MTKTMIALIIWAVIGPSIGAMVAGLLFASRESYRVAKQKHDRAADLRHDLINHVRLKAAARHAALAGQEWPPLPSDDVMHGSAS